MQDNLTLLRRHVGTIRDIDERLGRTDWRDRGRTNHRLCYVLERFHLTHVCHYPHLEWKHVEGVDDALSELGCRICLLTASREVVRERVVGRRNRSWRDYLSTVGSSSQEVLDHYTDQQNRFLDLIEASSMSSMVVDTSKQRVSRVAESVAAFWLGA